MDEKKKNGKKKSFSLLPGGISEISNPVSSIISKKAIDHMSKNNTLLKKAEDVSDPTLNRNSGLYIAPTDQVGNATQNEEYVIQPPTPYSRMFVVQNLPLAYRITFGVTNDCFKSGTNFPFSFVTPREFELDKEPWSDKALNVLKNIGFLRAAPQHMGVGEMDGEALLILIEDGFDWKETDVSKPRDPEKEIVDVMSIPMYYVYNSYTSEDWNDDGTPMYWYINFNSIDGKSRTQTKTIQWHSSRIIHYTPQQLDTSTKGLCTLDRCWQAICIGFNIDLGTGEGFFRWGIGHPVFETDYENIDQLKEFMDNLGSPNRRTWHALLRGMKLTFAGASGTTMQFQQGKETSCYDEICIATGIPRPVLKGEVAGVRTGSEVNERSYWSLLSSKQTNYNDVIWKLLAILNETGQVDIPSLSYDTEYGRLQTPENVIIKWAVHYVETEEQRIDILKKKIDTINSLKDVLTINELRAFIEDILNKPKGTYGPLPPEQGEQVLSIYESAGEFGPEMEEKIIESPEDKETPEDKKLDKEITEPETPESKGPKVPKVPKQKSKPHPPRKPGQERNKREKNEDEERIVGCPDHPHFKKSCPACHRVLQFKEDLAKDLLMYGFSINDVQSFVHLNRNKVNKIRGN